MPSVERFDVLIVGAGISGIGSAHHLQEQCPGKSFVILESHETFGGTWLIHRYPGTRSDSDLYTFGFRFKPWTEEPIATRERILAYLEGAIAESNLAPHIRYRHVVKTASWSQQTKLWTVTGRRKDTGEDFIIEANFLWMCQGYYRHAEGYTPDWPGMESFKGRIVHPQTWPEDLDYSGKRVLVIGSGATAATLIPAMARKCAHITMLQRSPTYFNPGNNEDTMADELRSLEIDEHWIHHIVRKRLLKEQGERIGRALREPEAFAAEMIAKVREHLGPGVDIEKHFTPRYRPWQQRVAFIPYGDLFQPFREGKASIVTDHIERFEETGVRLKSGELLEADIIVTATGFRLCVLGDIAFKVDGKPVDFAETVTYHGMMFTGVPNLVWVFGYFRASWTLRVEILADFVCRLLNYMDQSGRKAVTVELRPEDRDMKLLPWMGADNFNPGYLMRDIHLMPRRGEKPEWQHTQDYYAERDVLPLIDLSSSYFHYS
jgi:cation diffusion facilitator CzcD-associated flavoprotein CzcO